MKKIILFMFLFLFLSSLLLLPAAANEAVPPSSEEALGFTETLSLFFTENADTLLGILTLLGSLLVAFFYKTGLMPLLRSGLSALGDLLGKSRELTESFTKEATERFARVEENVGRKAHGSRRRTHEERKGAPFDCGGASYRDRAFL